MSVAQASPTAAARPEARGRHALFAILMLALYAAGAVLVGWLVWHNGAYPSGSDAMAHVYKADVLYRDILSGAWWPYVDPSWYNGVEILRYWAPLPVYALAGCEALAGGSMFGGYVLFCALIFFLGAVAWLWVGARLGRRGLGAFIGALWFFMPNNLLALFYEGNLPRSIALVMLPVLTYQVWAYLRDGAWGRIWRISVWFALIALCHSGYAGMIALAFIVWLVCDAIANRQWRRGFRALLAILAGYALIGIWLVPSLMGGITSTSSSEVMATFFQSLATTLDPLARLDGTYGFYFGLAAFVICVFGALCAKREGMPLFWAALVTLLLTSDAAYPLLAALPGGQYLWMLRFISIALAFVLLGLLVWKTLRKGLLICACALLVADAIPSLPLLYGDMSGTQPEERYEQEAASTLITNAQQVTTQRLALIDGSSLGSTGAYLVSGFGDGVDASFGAGWQSAATASNIRQINAAAEQGDFLYLFDRCKELGDDSVLIRTAFIKDYGPSTQEELDAAAERLGYGFAASNGDWRLYHLQGAPASWGTTASYDAIGIGTGAASLSLQYPGIEETSDPDLNHYTFDQLKGYKTIYLAGFTYDDQAAAEDLLTMLSEQGTRVVISSDGIPVNKNSHDRVFLGVRVNDVSFSNGYPDLDTVLGTLRCQLFPSDERDWHTSYLEGLDESWGSFSIADGQDGQEHQLDFIGTVKNDNIVMVGLNLGYYYSLTQDAGAGALLDKATGMTGSDLPERDVVPITVTWSPTSITIESAADGVDAGVAYHDEFAGQAGASMRNNLVCVGEGTTTLTFSYPYLWQGLALSAFGIVLLILLSRAAWQAQAGPGGRGRRPGDAAAAPDAPVALLIPAYDPDAKLLATLRAVAPSWQGPIIVVNDGSHHASDAVFDEVRAMGAVTLLKHAGNRGKGAALKTGLAWCAREHPECLGVVTADADGQHRAADIRAVAGALREHPADLVLGVRDFTRPDVPRRSSMGNALSRWLLLLSCGVAVSDTQTGLRGIPLALEPMLARIKPDRYEYETYMLAEAHREGVAFFEVPIETVYIEENASSHYRPVRDSLRIASIFLRYALSSLACAAIDLALFGTLSWRLAAPLGAAGAVFAATLGARVVSASVNFAINRHLVFKTRGSAARYIILAAGSMAVSALAVAGLAQLTGWNAVAIKACVDVALFFANYAAQRAWVFAEGLLRQAQAGSGAEAA